MDGCTINKNEESLLMTSNTRNVGYVNTGMGDWINEVTYCIEYIQSPIPVFTYPTLRVFDDEWMDKS